MMKRRPMFFSGAVYELVRFSFLFILGLGILTPEFDQVYILTIMLLSAPVLVMAAGFLLLGLFPDAYYQYRKILALGKLLELFPLIIGLLNSVGIISFADAGNQFTNVGLLFGILIFLDLLFFFFLVSYRRRDHEPASTAGPILPEMNEIEVKEK